MSFADASIPGTLDEEDEATSDDDGVTVHDLREDVRTLQPFPRQLTRFAFKGHLFVGHNGTFYTSCAALYTRRQLNVNSMTLLLLTPRDV